jgi:hypothetical protein
MTSGILPILLAGLFFLVIGYVGWLKFYKHLVAHRHEHEHEQRSHHLVAVRKIRARERGQRPEVIETR